MASEGLVGTWTLVSLYGESAEGDILKPYGDNPKGTLIYAADGSMSAVLMKQGRPKFASGDLATGTPEEVKAAFDGFDAYCGTFTLDESQNTVTHHIEVALFPNWEGTDQVRYYELSGDRLRIYTPPIRAYDKDW